jgi:hypothetical protein
VTDNDHLTITTTDRGLDRLPEIPSEHGGHVCVFESRAPYGPHVWLRATSPRSLREPLGPVVVAVLHLTADDARRLAEQLMYLVRNHCQGEPAACCEHHDGEIEAIQCCDDCPDADDHSKGN